MPFWIVKYNVRDLEYVCQITEAALSGVWFI